VTIARKGSAVKHKSSGTAADEACRGSLSAFGKWVMAPTKFLIQIKVGKVYDLRAEGGGAAACDI